MSASTSSMLKNAPHPNAARLFMNHYLEPDSQLVFANAGYNPVVKGVVEKTRGGDPPAARDQGDGHHRCPQRQDAMLALAKEIYK